MKAAVAAHFFSLLLFFSIDGIFCLESPQNLPGVYEVASNGQLNISIADIHRYETAEQGSWFLAIGLVIENRGSRPILLSSDSFWVLTSRGEAIPSTANFALKSPLGSRELGLSEVAIGGIAFKLQDEDKPVVLLDTDTQLRIRLDKEIGPPGEPRPVGKPAKIGNCVVGIEGISGSKDNLMLRVDYIMKNNGPGVMLLEPRDYGRFGVLIDKFGWSYSTFNYKMQAPAVAPGGIVEGFMTYVIPDGSYPRYLLFWPPDEDAILFDLGVDTN